MPTPKRPQRSSPKERKQLGELLREPVAKPPGSLTLRFDKGPRPATVLKELAIEDPAGRRLAEHLIKHREEIVGRLAADRDLAELLVNEPHAALKQLEVPGELLIGGRRELLEQLLGRFSDVQLGYGAGKQVIKPPPEATQAQQDAIALLKASMDIVLADPSRGPDFTTSPRALVTQAAQASGVGGGSVAAKASIVNDVVRALDVAAQRPVGPDHLIGLLNEQLATIPFRPRI